MHCPLGGEVVYLDCMECDDKACKKGGRKMSNLIVVGIDQSYQDTGVSISYNSQIKSISDIYLKNYKNNTERRNATRAELRTIFSKMSKIADKKGSKVICVIERIRVQNKKFFSSDYLIQMGALNSVIVDTAAEFNIPVYSVDTRSWKSRVVGTSKPKQNKYGIDPNKWATILWLIAKGYEKDLLKEVSDRKRKGVVKTVEGVNYTYNDNKADSACISLFPFVGNNNLLKEEH